MAGAPTHGPRATERALGRASGAHCAWTSRGPLWPRASPRSRVQSPPEAGRGTPNATLRVDWGSSSASFDVASGKSKSTMKVDGREARNYMNETMENGDCVITGYGFSQ